MAEDDMRRAYEDFHEGMEMAWGQYPVTAAEIDEFANAFDPQPMHLGGPSPFFDSPIASGWHVAAMSMRMMCEAYVLSSRSQGSPGVEQLDWKGPVYAGDTLSGRSIVLSCRRSKSNPGRGFVHMRHETTNQDGKLVCAFESTGMMDVRNPEMPA